MPDQLFFSRDTKVYIKQGANIWVIPVQDGFSFAQATNASEITLNEMSSISGVSRRARQMFTDSYAPAEWSFTTYARPFISQLTGDWDSTVLNHHAVEEALWANFLAVNDWNPEAAGSILTLTAPPTSVAIDRNPGVYVVAANTALAPGWTSSLAGVDSTFRVTVPDAGTDALTTIELISPGSLHAALDVITIPNTILGGTGDFTFTVATVESQSYWDKAVNNTTTEATFSFANSNTTELGEFELYFALGSCGTGNPNVYKIDKSVINSVNVNFDIDGIAQLEWSGFGSIITEEASTWEIDNAAAFNTEAAGATSNFIRNRLTTLNVQAGDDEAQGTGAALAFTTYPGVNANGVYNIVLTGGSIAFENNITYLTPETLCVVNQPIGHVTGTRSIGGSFTCYLNSPTEGGSSADLFEDMFAADTVITNQFALTFTLGGATAPKIAFSFPECHLELPTHGIEDVISVETTFHALPSSIDGTDEATIIYTGTAY